MGNVITNAPSHGHVKIFAVMIQCIIIVGIYLGLPLLITFGFHCLISRYLKNKVFLGVLDILVAFLVLRLVAWFTWG